MKKIIRNIGLVWAFLSLGVATATAQSDVDALRYSLIPGNGTTARSLGLGGAIGAVGADQAVVLSNPAGLAQFKTNSFNISLATNSLKNTARFTDGASSINNNFRFELPSINAVWTNRKTIKGNPVKTGWVNTNFQLGYNRVNNFNRNTSYRRSGAPSSYTDYVADYVAGINASELEATQEELDQGFLYFENMFWQSFLIDSISSESYYANYDAFVPGGLTQAGQIISEGGLGEYHMAFAGNYEHKVYFGASINLQQVNYSERNQFTEVDNPLTTNNWESYSFTRNIVTSGVGVGGRLGVIVRANDNLRIGGTIHTPVVLNLTDNYFDELYVIQDDGFIDDLRTIDKEYSYRITTPARFGLQGAYIFGKKGMVSAEIETADYSTMSITSDDFLFEDVNGEIVNNYGTATNFKIGGEYVLNSFRFRGGYSSIGNPFIDSDNYRRNIISGGFGIQERNWAFDLGISRDMQRDIYLPYEAQNLESPLVRSDFNGTRLMLTLTNKF